jgi:hypothetical protein
MAASTSARERRAIGFWLGLLFVLATVMTWTSIEHQVAAHILQALTLLLLCWTIVTTETPVEEEG